MYKLFTRVLFAVAIFVFTINTTNAQKVSHDIKKLEESADIYFEDMDYKEAARVYSKLDSLIPNNPFYSYRIGICDFNSHQRAKALVAFQKCRALNHHEKDVDFYLARTYHLNHEFDEAAKYYKSYKEILNGDTSDATLKKYRFKLEDLDRAVDMCELGKKMVRDSINIQIDNMGDNINTQYPEYVPVITADETTLMFTTRRPTTTGGKIDFSDNHYYEDIMVSRKDSASNNWSVPTPLSHKINSKFHDACIGLSPDGQKLFIYRSHKGKNSSGDIYESFLEGKDWTEPIKLVGLNTQYWENSATITADGKTLYFTSDRPGGFGGVDIYKSVMLDNGQWGKPENLGEPINTKYDEDGPYIHIDNKTLFFSSRGHETMGGFDVFTSVFDEKSNKWSKPVNIGYPINTADDDIYFVWSADGTKGYFSSWREDTKGEKDLYIAHRPGGSASLIVMKGKVFNKTTEQPVAATITITDNEAQKVLGIYNSNAVTGNYAVVLPHGKNYGVTVEAEGFVFYSDNYYIEPNNAYFAVEKNIYLEEVKVGSSISLRNVFFDFDKSTLRNESTAELDRVVEFLKTHENIQVEISGHTDSLGSDAYNLKLSDSRANSVVNYLINKGIKKDRLIAKGYGETQPLATNSTPDGRQLNRRTQFLIVGDNATPVTFENQPTFMVEYDPIRDKKGGKKGTKATAGTTSKPETETADASGKASYKVGDKLKPKIHFTFKQTSALTDFSKQMLDKAVSIMTENPGMKIRINSYSSKEGVDEMNRELARKRAETVYNYFLEKGIDKNRLETSFIGNESTAKKGEMDIANRRVDFEIIGL
jgi:outer membrane protein OmpA-like peptidoglycan-associated protein/tetratricopeptide (TPR) repeat protein